MKALRIDLKADMPVYRQIAVELRSLIAREVLARGEPLPSVRELGRSLGVNLNTVAKAYRQLADEGLITLKHGAQAVVAPASQRRTTEDEDGLRSLRDVLGQWATSGMTRRAAERAVHRLLDDMFEGKAEV